MRQYKKFESLISSFINENENYIVFNDGKPIRQNIIDENSIDICVDNVMDCFDICMRKRPKYEDDIISNAHFNNYLLFKKDMDIKIIYLNDEEDNITFSFDFERDINVNVTNIFLAFDRDTNILNDYNLNDCTNIVINNFTNYDKNILEYNNYYLDDKAHVEINNLQINKQSASSFNNVYLYSGGSSTNINNSCINASGEKQTNNFIIHHLEKQTTSELIGYGVVLNKSILNMDTNGIIKKGASKSAIHQTSKGILLDLNSSMSASPYLFIDEYDCLASHGASIGALDENDIFYLMSRGLDKISAEKLIVYGFFNPYLSKIKDEKILAYIENIIANNLENKNE